MLMIPIAALMFIGGSYLLALRFLPSHDARKAMPWMAGVALLGYFATQFLLAIILQLLGIPVAGLGIAFIIALSLLGALGCASLILRGFVTRHRRRKAEKEELGAIF